MYSVYQQSTLKALITLHKPVNTYPVELFREKVPEILSLYILGKEGLMVDNFHNLPCRGGPIKIYHTINIYVDEWSKLFSRSASENMFLKIEHKKSQV